MKIMKSRVNAHIVWYEIFRLIWKQLDWCFYFLASMKAEFAGEAEFASPFLELADLGNVFLVFNHSESLNTEEQVVFLLAPWTFLQKNERAERMRSNKILISKEKQDNVVLWKKWILRKYIKEFSPVKSQFPLLQRTHSFEGTWACDIHIMLHVGFLHGVRDSRFGGEFMYP